MGRRAAKARPQTSAKVTRRGFTLIELSVAIVVLALLSALVAPRLVALRSGQETRAAKFAIRDLAKDARMRAVQEGVTVVVRGSRPDRIEMVRVGATEGEETVIRSLDLPEGVRLGTGEGASSEWEIRFFGDGRAEGRGVEIEHDGALDSVLVAANGSVVLREGGLPQATTETWPAGENERRL